MDRYYQTVKSPVNTDWCFTYRYLVDDNTRMDIVAIRRRNLRYLIDTQYGGSQAAFVDKTGINQGELSGLLKKKSFGEKRARSLEASAGLQPMSLDKPEEGELITYLSQPQGEYQAERNVSDEETRLLEAIKKLDNETRAALLKITSLLPAGDKKMGGRRIGGERRQRENTVKQERRQNPITHKGGK